MGAVGPETCVLVPPKSDPKKPIKIAPYDPAIAPIPDCTPKASAKGSAATPAVKPPNTSPFIFLNKGYIVKSLIKKNEYVSFLRIGILKVTRFPEL